MFSPPYKSCLVIVTTNTVDFLELIHSDVDRHTKNDCCNRKCEEPDGACKIHAPENANGDHDDELSEFAN